MMLVKVSHERGDGTQNRLGSERDGYSSERDSRRLDWQDNPRVSLCP
jgi:hypothetical protein